MTPIVTTLNSGGQQSVETLVEELGQRLDVAGEPADRLPGRVPLVEGQRQPLDVREHPAAQGQQDRLTDPAGPGQEAEAQGGVESGGAEHRRR